MEFNLGDVVQVTQDDGERHLLFGMIGIVTEIGECIGVFFSYVPVQTDIETGLNGIIYYFDQNEISKIGVGLLELDYEELSSRSREAREAFIQKNAAPFSDLQARIKGAHLLVGSIEAKAHGCICEEVRNDDCPLHTFTETDTERTRHLIEKTFNDI